jgi:hypothetical protein
MSEQRADEAAIGRRSFTTGVTLTGAAALGAPLTRASAQTRRQPWQIANVHAFLRSLPASRAAADIALLNP